MCLFILLLLQGVVEYKPGYVCRHTREGRCVSGWERKRDWDGGWNTLGVHSLRMTQFLVPNHVVAGNDARLECNFDLEGEVLYAVKWYKDGNEFYHYQPADDPAKLSFPEFGVDVDMTNSSMVSVTLPRVPLSASGRYRCEVSGEAPAFTTISDHGDMTVIHVPEEGPHITGGKPRYQNGEWVSVNCSSAPAYPPPELAWFVNGDPAPQSDLVGPIRIREEPLVATKLGLRFKVRPKHFKNGDLKIKCLMTIGTMYSRSNEESVEAQRLQKGPALESRNAVAVVARNNSRADRVQGISTSATSRTKVSWSTILGVCALLLR